MNEDRRLAITLRTKGFSYQIIGKTLGVSRQYAQWLCKPPKSVMRELQIRSEWKTEPRGKRKCEACGEAKAIYHTHHIDNKVEVWEYNKLENLLYLCISCHREIHSRRLSNPKEALKWTKKVNRAID